MALAILGIIGAFIAPFILTGSAGTEHAGTTAKTDLGFWFLMGYIMAVDIGVLVLSTFRNWRWFTLIGLLFSLSVFGLLHVDKEISMTASLVSLTLIFLIFAGATTLFHIMWRRVPEPFDFILMSLNAAAYFGISYGLMWHDLRQWVGAFSLLLALFYGGLAYAAYRRHIEDNRLGFFALGIAIVFLTIAIPVQFGDRAWTTIAWAAEGTVLMWLALNFKISHFRYYSYISFSITAIRLLFFDTMVTMSNFQPIFNERVLAFAFSIAAIYLTSYLLWREQEKETAPETSKPKYEYMVFLGTANFFALWLVGAEIISYKMSPLAYKGSLPLVFLTVVAGMMTLYHLIWRRPSQTFDLVLIIVNAIFFLGISAPIANDYRVGWVVSICF